jgi:hypothetical protein
MTQTFSSVLLAIALFTIGCASKPTAPDSFDHYEKMAATITCPGTSAAYKWCGDLKNELARQEPLARDGYAKGLENYKRALGELLVGVSFAEVAHGRNEVLLHRPVNPEAYIHLAEGAPTKGIHIKGKSSDWGPHRGYIPVHEKYSKLAHLKNAAERDAKVAKYEEKNREALEGGFAVAVPLEGSEGKAVIRGGEAVWTHELKAGDEILEVLGERKTRGYITADVDMLAFGRKTGASNETLDDPEEGTITRGEMETVDALNKAFLRHGYTGGKIVQHGAEDRYKLSDGVDYPVTAFEPGGERVVIAESHGKDHDRALRRYFKHQLRRGYELVVNPNWHWN